MSRKRIKILLIVVLAILALLAGCSGKTPNNARVKQDLNASDFVRSKQVYKATADKMLPVTDVSIVDTIVNGDGCEVKCNVVLKDDNYRGDAQVSVFYSKFEEWDFDGYEIRTLDIVPISGVPNYIIKRGVEHYAEWAVGTLVENAMVTNIVHNFDANAKKDIVTFEYEAKGYTSKQKIRMTMEYSFENPWCITKSDKEVISHEWLFDELVGTSWSGLVGAGATRTITFNSIDTANKKMNITYYNSQDDCSYEFTVYQDSPAIIVYLPNESFTDQMWIFENGGIRYGIPGGLGGMLGKRVDKEPQTDIILVGSKEPSGSNDEQMPMNEESESSSKVPILMLIIAVVIIVVIAKKDAGKKKEISGEEKKVTTETVKSSDEKTKIAVDLKKDAGKSDDERKTRLISTFGETSEKSGTSASDSEEKKGDWFKKPGNL